jgi:dolichol-phosphate mannosyltransferase
LVLPAYNEQDTIEQAITEAHAALSELTGDYEILVVDDGSTDRTAAIVVDQMERSDRVLLVQQPRNVGYGAALRRGFRTATKHLVAFTDADCQFDLAELDRLTLLAADYDIVSGYRIDRQDPWRRKFYSGAYNLFTRLMLRTTVRDCDCALKVFRREVIQSIEFESDNYFANVEIFTKARRQDRTIVEVGVTHRPRFAGESKVSILDAIPLGASLLRFSWKHYFSGDRRGPGRQSDDWPLGTELAAVLLLVVVAAVLLLSGLSYPLIEPDEARYAEIALEMYTSGDWVTPRLEGTPYLDKPPLLYWATAGCYHLFGANERASRLPCAIASLLTVLITYFLGKRLVGMRAAWVAGLLLLLCSGFVFAGRFVIMDSVLTLFTLATLLASYLAWRGPKFHWGWWMAAGVACGLGVLTKGPVCAVLAAPPLLAARWLNGDARRIGLLHWAAFAAPVVLACAPWYLAIGAANHEFSEYFFWRHNILRFLHAFNHQHPWWFYLPVLFIGMFPASILLPPLAVYLVGQSPEERASRTKDHGFLLISALWTVVFFSLSSSKLPTYILPAIPPLCLLLGQMLESSVLAVNSETYVARWLKLAPRRVLMLALTSAVAAGLAHWFMQQQNGVAATIDWLIIAAAGIALPIVWRMSFAPNRIAWATAAGLAIAVMTFAFAQCVPEGSKLRSVHAEAATILDSTGQPDARLVYFNYGSQSARFHVAPERIKTFDGSQIEVLAQLIEDSPTTIIVTNAEDKHALEKVLGPGIELRPVGRHDRVYITQPVRPVHVVSTRTSAVY